MTDEDAAAAIFPSNEVARPETSKCSRGALNKFNKTLTGGFNIHEQSAQNDNLSQRQLMNMTGFNFRQAKQSMGESNGSTTSGAAAVAIAAVAASAAASQPFSMSQQGFYKNRKQNSFSSGITLEQYFQAPVPEEQHTPLDAKSSLLQTSQPPSSLSHTSASQQQQQQQQQNSHHHSIQVINESKQQHAFSDEAEEEQYNHEEFEIHEESDEERDEEDEADDYTNNRRQPNRQKVEYNALKKAQSHTDNTPTGSQKTDDSTPVSQLNARHSLNNGHQSSMENGAAGDAIQKKIRDKYFKKTIQKTSYQNGLVSSSSNSSSSSSNNSSSNSSTNTSSANSKKSSYNAPTASSPTHSQHQHDNHPTSGSPSILMSSNAANLIPSQPSQQPGFVRQSHFGGASSSVQANGRHSNHFYSENQNAYVQHTGFTHVTAAAEAKSQLNGPQTSGIASAASRKANRSQSPLYQIKRSTNIAHSQQRHPPQRGGEPSDSFSEECRRTFQIKDKSMMSTNVGSKVQQQQLQQQQQQQYGVESSHIAFRSSFYQKPPQQMTTQQSQAYANSQNSNLRLTVNEFYKNPHEQRGTSFQTGGYYHQNNHNEDYLADAFMRRTAKENKFLNQKDKISEMAREDASYLTKHAARFNINPAELGKNKI